MSNRPEIEQMSRKAIEAELAQARLLLFDCERHLANAIPFYGYAAVVEDLKEANYDLQRRCLVFRTQPPPAKLVMWLERAFDEMIRAKGIKPGDNRQLDEIGEFLGFDLWEKIKKERIGS